jgi:hypothetical protein
MTDSLFIPSGLCPKGRAAAHAIVALLSARGVTPKERIFFTPKEWRQQGQEYGLTSVLIVVYEDEQGVAPFFSLDACVPEGWGRPADYERVESQMAFLRPLGVYSEQCTRWYSSVHCC